MKQRNLSTLTRYREKCQKLIQDLPTRDITLAAASKLYAGSWYFYTILMDMGFLVRDSNSFIRWKGSMPDDKALYKIARKVNNMNLKGHKKYMKKKTKKKYTKKSAYWKQWDKLKTQSKATSSSVSNRVISLILKEIISECNKENTDNIIELVEDLKKLKA